MKDIASVRNAIKNSATELFSRMGYEKTTLEEIARKAHKAKASVYYHFKGKYEILDASLSDEFSRIIESLSCVRRNNEGSVPRQLAAYLEARMDLLMSAKVYGRYAVESFVSNERSEALDAVRMHRGVFDDWEREYFVSVCRFGCDNGAFSAAVKPEAFGSMMLMLLRGLEMQFFVSEDLLSVKSTYDEVLEYMMKGISKKA